MAQTKPKAGQFYGVSDNGTDGEFLQTDGTGGMAWASSITNPTITSIDYPGTATAANPAGGQSVIINGTLFASGITCTVGGTTVTTVFNSATQITINTPAKTAGSYTVAVTNSNGGTASQSSFIQYSGIPIWTTAAGNIGSVLEGAAASFQVTATEGTDTIEYAVTTGTLPTGLSLATATGAITGTAPAVSADTTTTFSITATDDENQTSAVRSFNIIVTNDGPSNHFAPYIYAGNGGTQNITLNFKPDLVWIKTRNLPSNHVLTDIVRGEQKSLNSDLSAAQGNQSPLGIQFESNGFTALDNSGGGAGVNGNSKTYVAWNFKAGGAAVANTNGTINSQVSVNNTLGFSIVSYTGTGSNASVGHGLDAPAELLIVKLTSGTMSWVVGSFVGGGSPQNKFLTLNSSVAAETYNMWQNTAPTSSVFTISTDGQPNTNNGNYIAYAFTSKAGFSKVGSYTGNGSTNGPMVNTGFEPAFVMVKGSSNSGSWIMYDNKRSTTNPRNKQLRADSNIAETTSSNLSIDFFANGFQLKGSDTDYNGSGRTFIYLAMAADGSTETPSLANSFSTQLYTGNNTNNQVVTGVGFKPDFTWISRINAGSGATNKGVWDSVIGTAGQLYSNLTNTQTNTPNRLYSFDSDGFTLGNGSDPEYIGNNNWVSWNWKAAGGTPSINTDGSIASLVSANQAAGFSIVKYQGNATNSTIGHNLSSAPEMMIIKSTTVAQNWATYHKDIGNQYWLQLNSSVAKLGSAPWNNTTPTNNVFSIGTGGVINSNNSTNVAFCFTSITGYSKVSSYTGNGNATGPIETTGFEPGFLMIKATTASPAEPWLIYDSGRNTSNPRSCHLRPNTNAISECNSDAVDFNATNFQIKSNWNAFNKLNEVYIYLAIKEN